MTQHAWHPEIKITKELVIACIEEQFPELTPIIEVTYIDAGWDNTVFLVNEQIIFRFPHRKSAVRLLETENIVLKKLHGTFELPIPNLQYVGKSSTLFPYPFHGYKKIPGNPGCARVSEQERAASITQLAYFLKKLHSIDVSAIRNWGVSFQIYDRTKVPLVVFVLRKRIEKIKQQNIIPVDMAFVEHEINQVKAIKLPRDKESLVHGDLYCKHLLFDAGNLSGIIDWGDTGIYNPVVDLAVIHGFFPRKCHNDFFHVYGKVDETTWQYARFIAIYYAYTCILYAHDVGDTPLFNEMCQSLQRLKV